MRTTFSNKKLSVGRVCLEFGYCRDAYYKLGHRLRSKTSTELQVLELVKPRRKLQPREGGRKVYKGIKENLDGLNLKVGRDKLFDILRSNDMLVRPRRSYVKTTNSKHRFYIYSNLTEDFTPTKKNQLWVSDITYIRTIKGFCYLALITDAYSRKIVGYDISNSLELEGALRALKKALKSLPAGHDLIHHSDRGIQYCSYEYTNLLKKRGVKISMASKGDCYENALAERVNGILKQEYYLDVNFIGVKHAIKACRDAIFIYNNHRLHMALNYKIPEYVHSLRA